MGVRSPRRQLDAERAQDWRLWDSTSIFWVTLGQSVSLSPQVSKWNESLSTLLIITCFTLLCSYCLYLFHSRHLPLRCSVTSTRILSLQPRL